MPKMTKQQLIELRKSTYRDQLPERCCGNCRRYLQSGTSYRDGVCGAIVIRHIPVKMSVRKTGICDLYELKVE